MKENNRTLYKRQNVDDIINQSNDSMGICYGYIKSNTRVLDVGCACGDFGYLAHKYKNCCVCGMEYNTNSIAIAMKTGAYQSIKQVDLDVFDPKDFKDFGTFDFIVLGDVLEHLRDPISALEKLKFFLKPGAQFVLSIPNIAHASIKAALLCNRFDYMDYGLLDRTHIHLFTWQSIANYLTDANIKVEELKVTTFDKCIFLDFNPFKQLNWFVRRKILRDPHSHVVQYVVRCIVSNDRSIRKHNKEKFNVQQVNRQINRNALLRRFFRFLHLQK